MYFEEKEFLSKKECKEIINIYKDNLDKTYIHGSKTTGTKPLKINNLQYSIFNKILNVIENKYIKKFFNECVLSNYEIVLWPKGSYMNSHYDEGDECGFFIYLNDDYKGGETELVGIKKIKPEAGKLLLFKNGNMLHKVNKVKIKERYMLGGWYI
ncbi:2OG-Fe(II) oxygenase [Phenylobacterium sp.]|jgi:hypothetical protein|uniref:2OG-Fe(II) oxygenase n=1 Tax=Phenylobacterium sp. TaxID=1871053 RepID=UPI000C937085|nr:2OG-Fe(II) oxygenase [Phenylobacterium sp.]MAK80506.1 hypothetical protein [Phenylobacterium sp.]|tara:strand:+ start:170 stop:634 length:465 start_codon:yes stop_codon:yes gene_type:complete